MKTLEEKRKYQREYMRKYNATEKGKAKNYAHVKKWRAAGNRKPEKRQCSGEWRQMIMSFLLDRDGPNCMLCHKPLDGKITIDHIIPVIQGGPHTMNNVQLAHQKCNILKAGY